MLLRKSVNNLTASEADAYIRGVKLLKSKTIPSPQGTKRLYDWFVQIHDEVNQQQRVHSSPFFLPWHRQFILVFERYLQNVLNDAAFALPYWDWATDAALGNPYATPLWRTSFMGGVGDRDNNNYLLPGTAFAPGEWELAPPIVNGKIAPPPPKNWLQRRDWRDVPPEAPTLPSKADVDRALAVTTYDTPEWDRTRKDSFRNTLEGWIRGADGTFQLHNRVHIWVGGSMLPMTSPNDPIFFLHHCNIDRIWAEWQARYPSQTYLPAAGTGTGVDVDDAMWPWNEQQGRVTPRDVLNIGSLGYGYAPP